MMTEQSCANNCPVLLYTSVVSCDNGDMRFCTTIEKFEYDMNTMFSQGYTPISLHEAYKCSIGDASWPSKPFCVIFEGGYKNNYTLVFPLLKKLNMPVSIFISTDLVGLDKYKGIKDFCPHFSWMEAKEMRDSGLVDIYPLWHPFDNGRNLIEEAGNKIALINAHLKCRDASLAFSYKDCTDQQLDDLHRCGVSICITNFSQITSKRICNGAFPAISVNYTSDVMDMVNQYRVLYHNALEKELVETSVVVYKKPSNKILADSIFLPIEKNPMVKNFLRHAFPLSVLQVDDHSKVERLVLNDYIEVIYKPWYDWFDYHNNLYNSWECLDFRSITADILNANNINVIEFIINGLKAGYYSDIWLDTYYIPGKARYNEKHMSHGLLIFGYDSEKQVFYAESYSDRERYEELIVPIKAVYMACSNMYFMHLNLIKKNDKAIVDYDIHALYTKLTEYINSICHDDNTRYSKKSTQQYYNYDATVKFCEHIKETAEKKKYVHMTALYGFAEHKRIMAWRLNYIVKRENLPYIDMESIYACTLKLAERAVNLGLKYNFTKNIGALGRLIASVEKLCADEKKAINNVLYLLSEKMSL